MLRQSLYVLLDRSTRLVVDLGLPRWDDHLEIGCRLWRRLIGRLRLLLRIWLIWTDIRVVLMWKRLMGRLMVQWRCMLLLLWIERPRLLLVVVVMGECWQT